MLPLPAMKALEAKKARIALRKAMEAMNAMQPYKARRAIDGAFDATRATGVAIKAMRIRKDKIARPLYWALKTQRRDLRRQKSLRAAIEQQRRWQHQRRVDDEVVGVYSGVTVYAKRAREQYGKGGGKGYKPQVCCEPQGDLALQDRIIELRKVSNNKRISLALAKGKGVPQACTTNTQWPQLAATATGRHGNVWRYTVENGVVVGLVEELD